MRLFLIPLMLGSVCLPSAAKAQSPAPDQPKAEAKAASGPMNPLGDTSRFTRLGGWGGFGGMVGQFGLAKAMLVTNAAVQDELKVTAEQKKELAEWEGMMRKRGETMFRGGGANPAQPPVEGGEISPPPPAAPGGFNPLAMIETISGLVREGETSLSKILNKKQIIRLNQIALQMEGLPALARPDVALAVNLSPEQSELIQEILNETKNNQLAFVFQQGMAMRNRRPTDTGSARGETKKDQAKASDPEVDEAEAKAKRNSANRERMQAQFGKMRDGTDQIQNASNIKILKQLSRKQRERFDKLLGPPFDPAKFATPDTVPVQPKPAVATATAPTPGTNRSTRLRDARGVSREE